MICILFCFLIIKYELTIIHPCKHCADFFKRFAIECQLVTSPQQVVCIGTEFAFSNCPLAKLQTNLSFGFIYVSYLPSSTLTFPLIKITATDLSSLCARILKLVPNACTLMPFAFTMKGFPYPLQLQNRLLLPKKQHVFLIVRVAIYNS